MKQNPLTLVIGFLLIVLAALLLFVFQVRTTQVAVVTTFGKATRDITEPGAYFKWPWPIQKVYLLDKPVRTLDDRLTESLTADAYNVLTSVYIGWRISEPKNFFPKFEGSVSEAEKNLSQLLHDAKTRVVGKHPLSDFISVSGGGTNFIAIENEILAALRSQLQTNYGIEIVFLGIKRLNLPEPVTASVFERMTSERQILISRAKSEGDNAARQIRSDAERRASEILAAAEAEANQIRGQGEAEAKKSLEVFKQNPELALFLVRLKALEDSLRNRSTLIFDTRTPPFDLFRGISSNQAK